MNERSCFSLLVVVLVLLLPGYAFANRGMLVIGPREVKLDESSQNAIVAWNGKEEILILSTDIRSEQPTTVLEVLPLPSNPTEVSLADSQVFDRFVAILNRKTRDIQDRLAAQLRGNHVVRERGVVVVLHKKIGPHDVTVAKVNDVEVFIRWVREFAGRKGIESVKVSREFQDCVGDYLARGVQYFVFDVIEATSFTQRVEPLIYRFPSEYLYYPLKITAMSDAGESFSHINLFLVTKGKIKLNAIERVGFWPGTGFTYDIVFRKRDLRKVNPHLAALFRKAYVMNTKYHGALRSLRLDLIIHNRDIHIRTLSEEIGLVCGRLTRRTMNYLSRAAVFGFVGRAWHKYCFGYSPPWSLTAAPWAVVFILVVGVVPFIVGVPAAVFLLAQLFLAGVHMSRARRLCVYVVVTGFVGAVVLTDVSWLGMPVFLCVSVVGCWMMFHMLLRIIRLVT